MVEHYNPKEDSWFIRTIFDQTIMSYHQSEDEFGVGSLSLAYEIHKRGENIRRKIVGDLEPWEYLWHLNAFTSYATRRLEGKIYVINNDDVLLNFLEIFRNKDKVEALRVAVSIHFQGNDLKHNSAFFEYEDVFYHVPREYMVQTVEGLKDIVKS